MRRLFILSCVALFLFSCEKDQLTITDIPPDNPVIDSCSRYDFIVDVDSIMLAPFDTLNPFYYPQAFFFCTCDTVTFTATNLPPDYSLFWDIFIDTTYWNYVTTPSTPDITYDALVLLTLVDTFTYDTICICPAFLPGYELFFEDC